MEVKLTYSEIHQFEVVYNLMRFHRCCVATTTDTHGTFLSLRKVPYVLLHLIPFPPPSGSCQPLTCFVSFAFSRLYKWNGTVCSICSFCIWLLLHYGRHLDVHLFIHVVGSVSSLFLFIDEWSFVIRSTAICTSMYLSVDGIFGFFPVLGCFMIKAAKNICL